MSMLRAKVAAQKMEDWPVNRAKCCSCVALPASRCLWPGKQCGFHMAEIWLDDADEGEGEGENLGWYLC